MMTTRLLSVLAALTCHANNAPAGAAPNPYAPIADRNAFGLVASVQEPVFQPPPVEKPRPTVRLSGIATVLPKPIALLEVSDATGKPMCLTLSEGDQNGGVELLSVDIHRNCVTIQQGAAVSHLTLAAKKPVRDSLRTSAPQSPNASHQPDQKPTQRNRPPNH